MDIGLNVTELSDRRAVIAAKGRMNAITAPVMKARAQELIAAGRVEIACDLSGVGFLDSSGLSALVSILKATREHGGCLKLAGLNEQVARIFKLTNARSLFERYPSVETALA
jgi:anti-sigma B factor antagonist